MPPVPAWLWKDDAERADVIRRCGSAELASHPQLAAQITKELERDGQYAPQVWDLKLKNGPGDKAVIMFLKALEAYANERRDQVVRDMQQKAGSNLELPGLGAPFNDWPERRNFFPCALNSAMEDLTNKPEWWKKISDTEIQARWKEEMISMGWETYREYAVFTPAMAESVIDELRLKAALYEETGLVPVMDYSMAVVKSDSIMTDDLAEALKSAVAPLEHVPEDQKDWHPGSNGQVLDIVHPSLWPLVYGKSRVLLDKRVGVSDAMTHCGTGEILPSHLNIQEPAGSNFSVRYQWLPCDVAIQKDGTARIESYINNIHPTQHADLYPVIEKFITKSLPAWELVYQWPDDNELQRIVIDSTAHTCPNDGNCPDDDNACRPWHRPLNPGEPERDNEYVIYEYYDEEEERLDMEWYLKTHPTVFPEPTSFASNMAPSGVKTKGFFDGTKRIQVIVKLANIHLTPDSPSYAGGSWHIEGLENEHICATALYYYDSENITDSHLDFRTRADREQLSQSLHYQQSDYLNIWRTFALDGDCTTQGIGSVLTRPGRALFFPNVYQHRVSPFKLADPSKPGHRKILALFLVDPKIPIISTTRVPPQRKDWWLQETKLNAADGLQKLPQELMNMVADDVDFPIDREEAEKIREKLIKERSTYVEDVNHDLDMLEFNFCEH